MKNRFSATIYLSQTLALTVGLWQSFSTCESRPPEGSWTIFVGVASRNFMYTAALYLLFSNFIWRSLGYSGLL